MYSQSVKGTCVMKWISPLRCSTRASLWQWLERKCMLTMKSGIWQSDVWVHVQSRSCVLFITHWQPRFIACSSLATTVWWPIQQTPQSEYFFFTGWPDHGVPQHAQSSTYETRKTKYTLINACCHAKCLVQNVPRILHIVFAVHSPNIGSDDCKCCQYSALCMITCPKRLKCSRKLSLLCRNIVIVCMSEYTLILLIHFFLGEVCLHPWCPQ